MSRPRPEPVQVVKERRDRALDLLVQACPIPVSWGSTSIGAATS